MNDSDSRGLMKSQYLSLMARRVGMCIVLLLGVVLFAGLFSVSSYNGVSLLESYGYIWDHITGVTYPLRSPEWWADYYIWNTSLPRAFAAILAGMGLAVCGTIMQAIMNNPLADPYATGISSGACLGAVAAIISGISFSTIVGEMGIVTNAFIGALIPAFIIIAVARRIGSSPATLILLGTAISYFFNALVTLIMVSSDPAALQDAYLWQVGSLSGMSWEDLPVMAVATVLSAAFSLSVARQMNVLSVGDKGARSLGIDVGKFRMICLVVVSLLTAAIVSYVGIIGFVGLVAPHIVRIVAGSDNRFVIPLSMLTGALLMLIADYMALSVTVTADIPVGVIMSMIGSPIFFLLIVFNRRGYGRLYRWHSPASP